MADTTYMPKVYHKRPGDELVGADGGTIRIESGGNLIMEPGANVTFPNPYGGADYFVDGNISGEAHGSAARLAYDGTVDGLSWGNAFAILSSAIVASNTSIALSANRWWARRNRIFCCGDGELTENLTTGAEKCDIIGVGYDLYPSPRITGNHIFTTKCSGMRLINLVLQAVGVDAASLLTFPDLNHGWQVLGCTLIGGTGDTGYGIQIEGCLGWKIMGNRFLSYHGDETDMFTEGIKQEVGSGQGIDGEIAYNFIRATEGIHILNGVTATNRPGADIHHNRISTIDLTINDASNLAYVTDNRLMTEAAVGVAAAAGGIVCNVDLASGNKISGGNVGGAKNADYPFVIQLTS